MTQFIGTHLLTGEAEYLDRLAVDGVPSKIAFYNGRMFVLTQVETGLDQYDSFISVYTYNLWRFLLINWAQDSKPLAYFVIDMIQHWSLFDSLYLFVGQIISRSISIKPDLKAAIKQ